MVIWLLVGVAAAIALAYRQAAATLWLGAGLIWLTAGYLFNGVAAFGATVAAVLVVLPADGDSETSVGDMSDAAAVGCAGESGMVVSSMGLF